MKYYTTTSNGFYIPQEIRDKFNLDGGHQQYTIVTKAKSRASANRRWKEVTGRSADVFHPKYTSDTRNSRYLELCDMYGEIISKNNRDPIDLKIVVAEMNEFKN